MSNILVWFFCAGIIMLFLSLVFFLFSIKYRTNKGVHINFDEDKQELESIIADARNLLVQLDEYSTNTINSMDNKIEEMKDYVFKFDNYKEQLEKYKTEIDNFERFRMEQKFEANEILNDNVENIINEEEFEELKVNKYEKIENPLHKSVIELYESGIKQEEISKKLEIGKNEVKLIINRYIK